MKVLVVGGAGYVGGAVTDLLANTRHEFRVYSVQFLVNAVDVKLALTEAKREARAIFDWQGTGDEPTVSVKPVKEPKEE